MKVLIVDDSERARHLMTSFVGDLVDDFVECGDGLYAMAAYSAHRPDLVLMDIQMKEVDGLTATKEIKAGFSDARVVIVSQWDTSASREAAREAGAEDYINKMNLQPLREILQSEKQKEAKSLGPAHLVNSGTLSLP